ncbi:NUDIX hydrolase [aff. Roholtiella sp. LEGE 12411]|uniref:NUDIX hydrolase n=1 Tax=aff. Roholtiella sp. LEGE 12411 TaxID=1828822 RepID=UPI00187FB0E1|nr:NUDIX hydrolase [aff. Roholtiella sp. LEGE 12411]MBE9036828.1 NUDIX hydrolase [aff. Roholtiella sp. LEGE 12411]
MSRKVSKVFKQSGVIPYRLKNGRIEILLITTRNYQHWVIPKGDIPVGMSPPDSAAKEAWEEAGVIGQVDTNELGMYKYRKRGKIYQVKMYLLPVEMVSEDYPEANQRKRQWLDVTKAIRRLKFRSLKRILKGFFQSKSIFVHLDAEQMNFPIDVYTQFCTKSEETSSR